LGLTQWFNTDSGFEFNTLFNTFAIVGALGTGVRLPPAPYPPGATAPSSSAKAAAASNNVMDNNISPSGGLEAAAAAAAAEAFAAAPALQALHLPRPPSDAVAAYYESTPVEVHAGLFLGSTRTLRDLASLRRLRITHVVLCTGGGGSEEQEQEQERRAPRNSEAAALLHQLRSRDVESWHVDLEAQGSWGAWLAPFVQFVWSAHGHAEGARVLVVAPPSPGSTSVAAAATLCMAFLLAERRCSPFEVRACIHHPTPTSRTTLMSQPQLHRTVSDNITVRKMVTRFATSLPTDNCPQPKEALLTVSTLITF
jgi:hypothetical protein